MLSSVQLSFEVQIPLFLQLVVPHDLTDIQVQVLPTYKHQVYDKEGFQFFGHFRECQ